MGQAFGSPLLVLEISGPFQGIAFGELYLPLHFPLGFSHGATHVAAPDREFHGAETSVVIPVDNQRAGNRMDIRQLADRNHGTILRRNQYLAYLILATAESGFVADHDIELTLVLIKQRGTLTSYRHLDNGLHVLLGHAVAG